MKGTDQVRQEAYDETWDERMTFNGHAETHNPSCLEPWANACALMMCPCTCPHEKKCASVSRIREKTQDWMLNSFLAIDVTLVKGAQLSRVLKTRENVSVARLVRTVRCSVFTLRRMYEIR